ncbi:MAG: DHHA1 domain-containing protein, partial [Actinomycetota bacterium]|nr:DHHA1 domain-containing protein [Actinomycetota bacterium]
HVGLTCEIGFVKITSEGSVGSNLRRIEAVTSFDAMNAVYAEEKILADTAEMLKVRPSEVADRVTALMRRLREADLALTEAKRRGSSGELDSMLEGTLDVGYPVVVARVDIIDSDDIRDLADQLRGKLGGGAVILAAALGQKVLLLAAGTDEAVAKGFNAGAIIKAIAPAVQGGGGGKPNMAQAGGKDPSGIDEALRLARQTLGVE